MKCDQGLFSIVTLRPCALGQAFTDHDIMLSPMALRFKFYKTYHDATLPLLIIGLRRQGRFNVFGGLNRSRVTWGPFALFKLLERLPLNFKNSIRAP